MSGHQHDTRVMVRPFSHRREGDSVVIGDLERNVYLSIPPEGFDLLQSLAAGNTVAETVRRFEQTHGETPDIDDFLQVLEDEGFVVPDAGKASGNGGATTTSAARPRRTSELPWISEATARRLTSAPVVAVCVALTVFGVVLGIVDFPTIPPPEVILFLDHSQHFAALTWGTFFIGLIGVAVHEVAHLVAARAAGVPARIGFGNQMYIITAQTTMTGIWLAPKSRRYIAFLAGSIIDGACASLIIIAQWADHNGWIHIPPLLSELLRAVLFTYMLRLIYQTFLFLRTDFYYVVANALKCRNLMADTETFLRNGLARVFRPSRVADQSHLPAKEMRAVRFFSMVWLLGRAMFLCTLFLVILPILLGYLGEFGRLLTGSETRLGSFDFLTIAVLALFFQGGGIVIWLRRLLFRPRRDPANAG